MRSIRLDRAFLAASLWATGCAAEIVERVDTSSSSDGVGGDATSSNGGAVAGSEGGGGGLLAGGGAGGSGSGGDGPPAALGHLLVTSQGDGSVKEFDEAGAFVRSIGGSIDDPLDAEVAPDGTILVTDARAGEVVRFTRDGQPLDPFASVGAPFGMVIDGETAYVCDGEIGAVRAFDIPSGAEVGIFPVVGGEGASLHDVAIHDGKLFAAEWTGQSIQVFDLDTGASLGVLLTGAGGIIGIDIGPDGDLYVSDLLGISGSVRRYDSSSGELVDQVVDDGPATLGVALGPDGLLYVADGSSGVRRFGLDGSGGEYFIQPGAGGLSNPYHLTFVPPP